MKSGIASAAVARPYFEGQKQASKNKPAVPLGRFYWTQDQIVTFSLERKERKPITFRTQ